MRACEQEGGAACSVDRVPAHALHKHRIALAVARREFVHLPAHAYSLGPGGPSSRHVAMRGGVCGAIGNASERFERAACLRA